MRDLKADKEICDKATPGPWGFVAFDKYDIGIIETNGYRLAKIAGTYYSDFKQKLKDVYFIAAAREGWPEAIDRAIATEVELAELKIYLVNKQTEYVAMYCRLDNSKTDTYNRAISAEEKVAALTEENDIQRASIQQLSAQVVELRDCIGNFINVEATLNLGKCKKCGQVVQGEQVNYCYICSVEIARELLASPDPGDKYTAQVAKMKQVVGMQNIIKAAEETFKQLDLRTRTLGLDMSNYHCINITVKPGEAGKDYWQAVWAYNEALTELNKSL